MGGEKLVMQFLRRASGRLQDVEHLRALVIYTVGDYVGLSHKVGMFAMGERMSLVMSFGSVLRRMQGSHTASPADD